MATNVWKYFVSEVESTLFLKLKMCVNTLQYPECVIQPCLLGTLSYISLGTFHCVHYYLPSNCSQSTCHIHWINMSIMFLTTTIKQACCKMSGLIEPVFPHTPNQYTDSESIKALGNRQMI